MSHIPLPTGTLVEHLFEEVADTSDDGIALCDPQRRIVFANKAFIRQSGYTRRQLIGKNITQLYPPSQRASYSSVSAAALRTHKEWSADLSLQTRKGARFPCRIRMTFYPSENPKQQLVLVTVHPRADADAGDAKSRARCFDPSGTNPSQADCVLQSMTDAVLTLDANGTILSCNRAFADLIGVRCDTIPGTRMPYPWLMLDSVTCMLQALKTARKGGTVLNETIAWRNAAGSQSLTSMSLARLHDADRSPGKHVLVLRDVSNVEYSERLRRADDRIQILRTELQRKGITLNTLLEIQRLVLNGAPLVQIFREIISAVQKLVKHDLAGLYLINADNATLSARVLSRKNAFTRRLEKFSLPIGEGLVGTAASTGQSIMVNDAHMDPLSVYPSGKRPDKEHVIVVPLRVQNTVFGVLALARNTEPVFLDEDAALIESFANAAVLALENARVARSLGKGKASRLHGITVASPARKVFPRMERASTLSS